jgi:ribosomal protein L3 glutamine methyltransferase
MAEAFPNADIDAADISADALEVAKRNVSDYGLEEQIRLVQTDLYSALEDQQYDVIITNPPYVNAPSMDELPAEYQAEPILALASGEDGLDHIRTILQHAATHLYPKGLLIAEIGHNREELEAAYPNLPFTWLETDGSDEFVFILSKEQLAAL